MRPSGSRSQDKALTAHPPAPWHTHLHLCLSQSPAPLCRDWSGPPLGAVPQVLAIIAFLGNALQDVTEVGNREEGYERQTEMKREEVESKRQRNYKQDIEKESLGIRFLNNRAQKVSSLGLTIVSLCFLWWENIWLIFQLGISRNSLLKERVI